MRAASASAVEKFRRCPSQWWLSKRYAEPSTPAQQAGVHRHWLLERYLRTGDPVHDPVIEAGLHVLPEGGTVPREQLEFGFDLQLPGWPVPLHGWIDLLEPDANRITDYKFRSSLRYAKQDEELAGDVQAVIYAAVGCRPRLTGKTRDSNRGVAEGTPEPVYEVLPSWEPVTFRHVSFSTDSRVRKVHEAAWLMEPDGVQENLAGIESTIRRMLEAEQLQVLTDVEYNLGACEAYGGCHFKTYCAAAGRSVAGAHSALLGIFQRRTTTMSSFLDRISGAKPASAPASSGAFAGAGEKFREAPKTGGGAIFAQIPLPTPAAPAAPAAPPPAPAEAAPQGEPATLGAYTFDRSSAHALPGIVFIEESGRTVIEYRGEAGTPPLRHESSVAPTVSRGVATVRVAGAGDLLLFGFRLLGQPAEKLAPGGTVNPPMPAVESEPVVQVTRDYSLVTVPSLTQLAAGSPLAKASKEALDAYLLALINGMGEEGERLVKEFRPGSTKKAAQVRAVSLAQRVYDYAAAGRLAEARDFLTRNRDADAIEAPVGGEEAPAAPAPAAPVASVVHSPPPVYQAAPALPVKVETPAAAPAPAPAAPAPAPAAPAPAARPSIEVFVRCAPERGPACRSVVEVFSQGIEDFLRQVGKPYYMLPYNEGYNALAGDLERRWRQGEGVPARLVVANTEDPLAQRLLGVIATLEAAGLLDVSRVVAT